MEKKDTFILGFTLVLLGFFGLSFLSFMANPIMTNIDWLDASIIIYSVVAVWGVSIILWWRSLSKIPQIQ